MAAMGSVLEILDINAILLALKTHLSVHFSGGHPAFLGRRKRVSGSQPAALHRLEMLGGGGVCLSDFYLNSG